MQSGVKNKCLLRVLPFCTRDAHRDGVPKPRHLSPYGFPQPNRLTQFRMRGIGSPVATAVARIT